jgi:acyl-CoA thioesterase I
MVVYLITAVAAVVALPFAVSTLLLALSRSPLVLPKNSPARVLARGRAAAPRPLVVCAGDSITQGLISAKYVDLLAERFPTCDFVNAGVNSHLAWCLLRRCDEIIRLKPDVVTVLIGTNDANAMLSPFNTVNYFLQERLPRRPSADFFVTTLSRLARRLKRETQAHVALLSLPPIGEDPRQKAFETAAQYSLLIREVAAREQVDYLPLHEQLTAAIEHERTAKRERLPPHPPFRSQNSVAVRALVAHLVRRQGLDEIGAASGFTHLVDFLHLNNSGGAVVAGLVGAYLQEKELTAARSESRC